MRITLAAMFTFSRQPCWWWPAIVVAGLAGRIVKVESLGVARTDASRLPEKPILSDDDDEQKLLADLERVQRAATEDLNPAQFDRDMGAAFLAYGLDLDRVEYQGGGAKLAGRRSTVEVVAAIDDWCNVRRRELGAQSWRRLSRDGPRDRH